MQDVATFEQPFCEPSLSATFKSLRGSLITDLVGRVVHRRGVFNVTVLLICSLCCIVESMLDEPTPVLRFQQTQQRKRQVRTGGKRW